MGQVGGCTYQYKIGDIFTLRCHKKGNNRYNGFWYDPRFRDTDFGERFELIK